MLPKLSVSNRAKYDFWVRTHHFPSHTTTRSQWNCLDFKRSSSQSNQTIFDLKKPFRVFFLSFFFFDRNNVNVSALPMCNFNYYRFFLLFHLFVYLVGGKVMSGVKFHTDLKELTTTTSKQWKICGYFYTSHRCSKLFYIYDISFIYSIN